MISSYIAIDVAKQLRWLALIQSRKMRSLARFKDVGWANIRNSIPRRVVVGKRESHCLPAVLQDAFRDLQCAAALEARIRRGERKLQRVTIGPDTNRTLFSKVLNNLNSERMTKREQAVLGLLMRGLTDKAIAIRLGNAVGTIKFHVKQLRKKLGANSRTEAILLAQRRGLLPREIPHRQTSPVNLVKLKLTLPVVSSTPSAFSHRIASLNQRVEQ